MKEQDIIERFRICRYGKSDSVVVEGIHAFKHAYRFGAKFENVFCSNKNKVISLTAKIASEREAKILSDLIVEVDGDFLAKLSPHPIRTELISLVKKPEQKKITDLDQDKPIVFLENPHDTKNVGATVRVAAAFGVAALCVSGEINPWHAGCVKSGSGLHFAIPIFKVKSLEEISSGRMTVACDADGENMYETVLPKNSILVFGTERYGITDGVKKSVDKIISIPMMENVSSLNLATSVSAVLFGANFS
ncbi:MAG: RNA methyltransferase [Candidatus Moranbacteria bacterium]|nr:RNA methyltransferase [Candidatus Moranbacteria bacterium]